MQYEADKLSIFIELSGTVAPSNVLPPVFVGQLPQGSDTDVANILIAERKVR